MRVGRSRTDPKILFKADLPIAATLVSRGPSANVFYECVLVDVYLSKNID
jgi:hypothetical protein